MSRTQRHINTQSNTINEVSYAILQQPTNAAFIPKETVETNEKTEGIRQTGETIYSQSASVSYTHLTLPTSVIV